MFSALSRPPNEEEEGMDNSGDDDDTQFPMEDENLSEEVRSKLHNESTPIPVASRQVSESSTDSTITSGRSTPSENCAPIQEESK